MERPGPVFSSSNWSAAGLYNSVGASAGGTAKGLQVLLFQPPAIKTVPSGRRLAVDKALAPVIPLVVENLFVGGSYSRARASRFMSTPPLNNTLPSLSKVGEKPVHHTPGISPNPVDVPVAGSYTSALIWLG